MRRLILILLTLITIPLTAASVREEMIVSPDWLSKNLDKVILIEVGDPDHYAKAHLPGARLIPESSLTIYRGDKPNELPSVDDLEALFSRLGVGNSGRVILYSREPLLAARAWFTLDYLGHGERAAILDGGFARWADQGRKTTSAVPSVQNVPFHARVQPDAVTNIKAVKWVVNNRPIVGKTVVLIDSRPSRFFRGEEAGEEVVRAGHIPGAVNVPWGENVTIGGFPRFLPEQELRELYTGIGVSPTSTNIVYCRTGMEASLAYFVLRYLGYEATLYDGSFVEWSADTTASVATASPLKGGEK
jgi:thiosulfate/3-mercaptopyruvate sulfurtransferase